MISRLQKGESPSLIDTDKGNEIIDAINAITNSKGSKGIEISADQDGGLNISLRDKGAAGLRYQPLEIMEITDSFIAVNPATINNELITPVGGLDFNPNGDQYLIVDVRINNQTKIQSAKLRIDSAPPDGFEVEKNKAPGDFSILIATIHEKSHFQVRVGSMTAYPSQVFSVPKTTVNVGEYDHDVYYSWTVISS
jgi:hypothetical protein